VFYVHFSSSTKLRAEIFSFLKHSHKPNKSSHITILNWSI